MGRFVIQKINGKHEIRLRRMNTPIGPRLLRKSQFLPDIPTTADSLEEAEKFRQQWEQWCEREHKRKT